MDISYGQIDPQTNQPASSSSFFFFFNQYLNTVQVRAFKSNGTLLPRPARYFRTPPWNGRGFGNRLSLWNLNLSSSILTIPPPGLDGDDPPLVSVYELGSSIALAAGWVGWSPCEIGREEDGGRGGSWEGGAGGAVGGAVGGGGGGAGGADGADVDGGGGGGGGGAEGA